MGIIGMSNKIKNDKIIAWIKIVISSESYILTIFFTTTL